MASIGELAIKLRMQDEFSANLAKQRNALAQWGQSVQTEAANWTRQMDVDRAANSIGSRLSAGLAKYGPIIGAAVTGAAISGITAAGYEILNNWGAAMDKFAASNKLSKILGANPEEIGRLAYAAKIAGVDFDSFAQAAKRFEKNLGEAAAGSKDQAEAFRDLGLDAATLQGKSFQEQWTAVARSLENVHAPSERMRLAISAMGRQAADILPMLEGLDERLKSMGTPMTAEQAAWASARKKAGRISEEYGEDFAANVLGLPKFATKWHEAKATLYAMFSGDYEGVQRIEEEFKKLYHAASEAGTAEAEAHRKAERAAQDHVNGIKRLTEAFKPLRDIIRGVDDERAKMAIGQRGMLEAKFWQEASKQGLTGSQAWPAFMRLKQSLDDNEEAKKFAERRQKRDRDSMQAEEDARNKRIQWESQQKQQAGSLFDQSLDPLGKYVKSMNELQRMLNAGRIDEGTYGRLKEQYVRGYGQSLPQQRQPSFLSDTSIGSAGWYRSLFAQQSPIKKLEDIEKEALDKMKEQTDYVRQIWNRVEQMNAEPDNVASLN